MRALWNLGNWRKCVSLLIALLGLAIASPQEVDRSGVPMPLRRLEWFYSLRRLPDGTVPADGWLRAWEQAQALPLFQMGDFAPAAPQWQFIGPETTVVRNRPPGDPHLNQSYLARVTRIAISPSDPDTIYVGATRGGLWKSTDGGNTWQALPLPPFANAIGAITLHPQDPNTIFVGTGDEVWFGPGQSQLPGNPNTLYGVGLYRSTDAGQTWQRIDGATFNGMRINEVLVIPDPSGRRDRDILIVCADTGIWRSTNGGQTWSQGRLDDGTALVGVGTALVANPEDTSVLLAAIGDFRGDAVNGVYRSTDQGETWARIAALPSGGAVGRIVLGVYHWEPRAHTDAVREIAVAGGGARLASGGLDQFLKVWSVSERRLLWQRNAGERIRSVAYSRNGAYIAAGLVNGMVRVWNADGTLRFTVNMAGAVTSVSFSPDSSKIAAGSGDRTVKVWTTNTGLYLATLNHSNQVAAVAFSPDGQYLASMDVDGYVKIWNASTFALIRSFRAYNPATEGLPRALAWRPNSSEFATGVLRGIVRRWRVDGTQIGADWSAGDPLQALAYTSDNTRLLAAAAGYIEVWQIATATRIASIPHPGVSTVAASPTEPERIFSGSAANDPARGVVYEVASWGLQDNTTYWRISGQKVFYAAFGQPCGVYCNLYDLRIQSVWRTDDGGTTWTQVANPPIPARAQFTWYAFYLKVDPFDYYYAYLGELEIWRTSDRGANWRNRTYAIDAPPADERRSIVHVDQHTLAFYPNQPWRIYAGNDGGLYYHPNRADKTTNNDGTPRWQARNRGRGTMEFYGFALHPGDPNQLVGGAQDNGVQRRTVAGGLTFDITNSDKDGGHAAYKRDNPNIVLSEYQNAEVYRSTDGGATWNPVFAPPAGDAPAFIAPLTNDPIVTTRFYVGTTRVFRSTDNGATFAALAAQPVIGQLTAITVANFAINPPQNIRPIYVGSFNGRVARSRDDGASWQNAGALPVVFPVGNIAVAPRDNNNDRVFVALQGFSGNPAPPFQRVFYSDNNGAAWTDISGTLPNAPVNDIVLHPDKNNILFVATDVGVFIGVVNFAARTAHWSRYGTGLPTVPVTRLSISGRTLGASTFGRGIWTAPIPPIRNAIFGRVQFQNYVGQVGYPRRQPRIELVDGNGNVVESDTLILDVNGNYVYLTNQQGVFTVRVKETHWLRQAFRNVNLNTDVTLNFNLINGDVNNDNLIDDADLLRVLFAFGQRCDDCPEDLNGDGMVDDADLLIVLFNFGRQGD
jgi:WD40 repeat protein